MSMRMLALFLAAAGLPAQQLSVKTPLELSLHRAIEMATSPEGNTNVQLSGEALKQSETKQAQARSSLLPDLEGAFNVRSQTQNLAALGLGQGFAIPIPGFHLPTFVGPFTTMDARVS